MIIVKLTILLWVLTFFMRWLILAAMSREERLLLKIKGKVNRMTFFRLLMLICFLSAVVGTIASVVWLLFFY